MPSALNAALWITGERLWATGQPITPRTRVSPSTVGAAGSSEADIDVAQMSS